MTPYCRGATSKKDLYGHCKIFVSTNYITHAIECVALYIDIGNVIRSFGM